MADENQIEKGIQELQNKIVDFALLAFSSIASVIQLITLYRAIRFSKMDIFILQGGILLLLLLVTIFRKKLSCNIKILFILILTLLIFVTGLYTYGFLASSIIYVAIAPVFVSFVTSARYAKISLAVFIFTYFVFCFLYSSGYLVYTFSVIEYVTKPVYWIQSAAAVAFTSIGLMYISYYYRKALIENLKKISKQNIELTDSEKKYRALFESSNDAIVLIKNNVLIDCNENTFKLFSCSKDFIIGKTPADFSPEYQPDGILSSDKVKTIFSDLADGKPHIFDWQHKRPDGSLFDVSTSVNAVILDNMKYTQAIIRDITEKKIVEKELENHRKNLMLLVAEKTEELLEANKELKTVNEELKQKNEIIHNQNQELNSALIQLKNTQMQLTQSEKMASLGILTSGVAHEINNPLNFIMGGYTGLQNYFKEKTPEKSDNIPVLLEAINTGLSRISSIVNELNLFSSNDALADNDVNIHSMLEKCLLMLANKTGENISVKKYYTNEPISIKGNTGRLHQAFLNILYNSVQAIENSGEISITTQKDGDNIIVKITDSGCGIPKEILHKITDPFFTTKEPGTGTGLGLAVSYAVINEHKGSLKFKSEPGKGTTVTTILPQRL